MKYWFFDGNDVIGPFTPRELAARADFSVDSSLVCPENFSEDDNSWKPASLFADFGPDTLSSGSAVSTQTRDRAVEEGDSSAEETALFDKEMDTFLKNPSILAGTAAPAPEGPGLEIPKKPAKPGPIEDYFNNINGEDLGDILGIPDPNEISDMNLPRVVDGRFDNTTPPTDKIIDFVEEHAAEQDEDSPELPPSPQTIVPPEPVQTLAQPQAAAPEPPLPEPQPVEREEQAASVPMSEVEGEALIDLPGEAVTQPPAAAAEQPLQEENSQAQAAEETVPTPSEQKPEPLVSSPEPVQEPSSVQEEIVSPEEPTKEPEEEYLSTCTLPLVGERENMATLPTVPEDGAPFVPPEPPAAAEFEPQEQLPPAPEPESPEFSAVGQETAPREAEELITSSDPADSPAELEAESPETRDTKADTVRDILRGALAVAPETEELKEPIETVPVEPSLNQVKPKLNQTPEIEQFLTTQRRQLQRARQRKANVMLWVVILLLAAGGLAAALHFFGRSADAPAPVRTVTEPSASPDKPVPVQRAEESVSVPSVSASAVRDVLAAAVAAPPAPLTAADKALAAVQNHQLPGGKGTIASYFDRLYKTQLSQGYTGEWSAEALHKNTYIVKYRLSKTRVEPIVYVFQADAARGKLTGALNNIALDLVGKI